MTDRRDNPEEIGRNDPQDPPTGLSRADGRVSDTGAERDQSRAESVASLPFSNILIAIQLILTFALGVFGNKVAELVAVDALTLLVATILIIVLLIILGAVISRPPRVRWAWLPKPRGITQLISSPSKSANILPFALVLGMLLQAIALAISVPFLDISFANEVVAHGYEVLAGLLVLATMLIFRGLRDDFSLMLTYSIGTAIGIATTGLLLRPAENNPLFNYGGWMLVVGGLGLAITSKRLRDYVADTLNRLAPR
jgi:hypothetical protein